MVGSAVALLEAGAMFLDVRLGIAVAIALLALALILARPTVILPLAITAVLIEHLTFNGTAISRLLAPVMLVVTVAEVLRGGARVRGGIQLVWTTAYTLWALTSELWTRSSEGTSFLLQSLVIALVFMLAFAAFVNTEKDLWRALCTFAFVAALTGGLSVLAFAEIVKSPQLELVQAGRSQGLVGDPDFFAAMLLVALPLALVVAGATTRRLVRIGLYASVVVMLTATFTSLSRGGFIGLAVLGVLLLASRPQRVFRSRREKAAILLVVTLGMVALFSRPFVRDTVVQRAESIYAPENRDEASGAGRTNLWRAAANTAGENLALGVGFGSFRYISNDLLYRTPGVDPLLLTDRRKGDNFVAHNTYLGTAAELGLPGLALYVAVVLSTGLALRRTAARAFAAGADFVGRVAHALLLGLASWTITSIFLSAETARMFWIIVGLSLALPKLLPQAEGTTQGRPSSRYLRSNAPMS